MSDPNVAPTPTRHPDIFAGILVGGRGKRLGGRDKARLQRPDGTTFLQHIVDTVRPQVQSILLAGRADQSYDEYSVPLVPDMYLDAGPLAGLSALLTAAPAPWCFLVACDLGNFDAAVLDLLVDARTGGEEIIAPVSGRGVEPTCALYATSLALDVRMRLDQGERALHRLIAATPHARVALPPTLEATFVNVNEPADLRR